MTSMIATRFFTGHQASFGLRFAMLGIIAACLLASRALGIDDTFIPTGGLAQKRANHTATALADGKILVVGGYAGGVLPSPILASGELFNPGTGMWGATSGNLGTARQSHTATLLGNGKVLVTGGYDGASLLGSAELYDPVSGTWSFTGSISPARWQHTATLLANGKVLVAGGYGGGYLDSTAIYDSATGTWSSSTNSTNGSLLVARSYHTATTLPDGRVLVVGGEKAGASGVIFLQTSELYDPQAGLWSATSGSLTTARESHAATLLPNGKVLITGGFSGTYLSSAELYDPANGTWSAAASLLAERAYHTSTLLPNGKVLVSGGQNSGGLLPSAELYDPSTGDWTTTAGNPIARIFHTATLLTSGKVLVVGGYDHGYLSSADIYAPEPATIERWRKIWYGFATNTGNAADTADPYHTGIPNLAVFAFLGANQNPAQSSHRRMPRSLISGGNLYYEFLRPPGIEGINYGAEWSVTLQPGDWHPITDTGAATESIFSVPTGTNSKLFIRLTVTH